MIVAIKALSWVAVAVLVGVGLRRHWLAPRERLPLAAVLIAVLAVPVAGALDLWQTVAQVRSPVDYDLWWRYASTTAHGQAVLWRSVAALGLGASLTLLPRAWWPVPLAFAGWLFYGFSRLSHAAAMGGAAPLVYDLVHLAGAAAWAGGVWLVAFTLRSVAEVDRLSSLALWVVASLAVTGVLSALVHVSDPPRFLASGYALAMFVKLLLVMAALAVAGVNRYVLLPRYQAGEERGLRTSLYVESVLLLGVLIATGWLSTSPLPHGEAASTDAIGNLGRLIDHLFR